MKAVDKHRFVNCFFYFRTLLSARKASYIQDLLISLYPSNSGDKSMLKSKYKYVWIGMLTGIAVVLFSCFHSRKTCKVLVVHTYEDSYAAYPDFNRMIDKEFRSEGIAADIRTFYLDCEQYRAAAEETRMYLYMDSIAAWKPDLILVYEDQATYTLMACKHPYVATVPVVFAGVNFPNRPLLKHYPLATGFWDKPDYLTNVRLMEQILGKISIYMLHDHTHLDEQIKKEVKAQLASTGIPLSYNIPMYLSLKEFDYDNTIQYLKRPDTTTVNIIPVQEDRLAATAWYMSKYAPYKHYLQAKRDYRVMNTSRFASKPSFTAINEDFGYASKLVGGYFTSLPMQVKESVERAAEILKGKPVSDFSPVTESAKEYVFDYAEIEFWKLDPKLLPENAVYLHRPFHKHYPFLFWSIVALLFIGTLTAIIAFIILYIRQVQAKRAAQKALLQEKDSLAIALKKAEESDRMKSVFLANMSHEIRTPLNAIAGFSQLIADPQIPNEEKNDYSDILLNNVDLLLKLIQDILDLARIESGHLVFNYRKCNLTDLFNEVYQTYVKEIPEGVTFRKHVPPLPSYLYTDPERLMQVLDNLIKNAIKFTTAGTIEIGYTEDTVSQAIQMYVKDTGLGIPADKQEEIFERFSKLNEFVQGTGLGLAICQVIVKRFNGTIRLQSEEGKGSCFTVELPPASDSGTGN